MLVFSVSERRKVCTEGFWSGDDKNDWTSQRALSSPLHINSSAIDHVETPARAPGFPSHT